MTVAARVEWKIEQALISVLNDESDITDVATVVRFNDESQPVTYPRITVQTAFAEDEPWANRLNYTNALVNLRAYTYRRDDKTGLVVANLIGAIRDTVYGSTFLVDLAGAVSGFTAHGVLIEGGTVILDSGNRRIREMSLNAHVSAFDEPATQSSSSSSSST